MSSLIAILTLITALLTPVFSFAATTAKCSSRQLKRQDCHLKIGNFEINLLAASVTWNNGTWRMTEPMPLKGEGVEWEKVTFDMFDGWPVLQLWIWDAGRGEAKVQALNWYTISFDKQKLNALAEGIVQRRRTPAPETKPILDKPEPHSLKYLKNGKLDWQLGRDQRTLSKPEEI